MGHQARLLKLARLVKGLDCVGVLARLVKLARLVSGPGWVENLAWATD